MAVRITQTPAPVATSRRLRVAAYARISETKGNTPASLSAQISYYNQKITENPDWEYAGVYADAGASGTNTDRPQFRRLLGECESGRIDLVLTKSISRFARNTVDLLEVVRHLKALGVEVIFERENIRTLSGDGELMLSILASFAQEEAWSVSANVKWGIRKNFEKGITNQMCVYGYIWTGSEFIINEKQAEAVRYIYRRFLEDAPYADIIRECEDLGYEAYWGGRFTTAALKMILRQERYTGNTLLGKSFNPYPGHHGMKNTGQAPMYFAEGTNPVIIDQTTFDKVQPLLEARTARNRRAAHNQTITVFSGNVWCGPCSAKAHRCLAYRDKEGHEFRGWRCPRRIKGKPNQCEGHILREDRIKEITCLLTGATTFTDELFRTRVNRVVMTSPGEVEFQLCDGRRFQIVYSRGKYARPISVEDIALLEEGEN